MMTTRSSHFRDVMAMAIYLLDNQSQEVEVRTWQGADVEGKPDFVTREVLDYSFAWRMPDTPDAMADQIEPDLPWADKHFRERVSGLPMNPGTAYKAWPWHTADIDKFLDPEGQFDVSYMDRIWAPPFDGMKWPWGNLGDVIAMLKRQPFTRSAYLPLFFPEDTGRQTGRTMCSLGYHFMRRDNLLHLWYDLRSCDFIRHFRNDVYFACRMAQWVL